MVQSGPAGEGRSPGATKIKTGILGTHGPCRNGTSFTFHLLEKYSNVAEHWSTGNF